MADGIERADERRYTLGEIAAALGVSKRAAERRSQRAGWPFTEEPDIGGQRRLFALADLPPDVQAALLLREPPAIDDAAELPPEPRKRGRRVTYVRSAEQIQSIWTRWERLKQPAKDLAAQRLRAVHAIEQLTRHGVRSVEAMQRVSAQLQREGIKGASAPNLFRWLQTVRGAHRSDWLALLAPHHVGRTATAECDPEAWEMLKALYLTQRQPALSTCYRRVQRAAAEKGWRMPYMRTLARRLKKEFAPQEIAFLRGGQEALEKVFPPQTRDRSMFEAMDAVNGDGVLFVPWCVWPTGEIARPKVWVWQCLGTGKILAWRADVSENTDMLRLAFGDLVERWGIPRKAFIDNTMAAANTVMTGGVRNRYRFKVKEESITGVMPLCGVEVHFVRPAHGQSKPIERAFRDLRELIDHHPKYATRGTKDKPLPIGEWLPIFEAEVAAHNAQSGRRGAHFAGRSFDEVFAESYARTSVRKATVEQRRLWLLASDKVRVDTRSGCIVLGRGPQGENRYWCEDLTHHMGRHVVARFDPQKLQDAVHVYSLDGLYIGLADCISATGFEEKETSRAYYRARGQFEKKTKEAARAKRRMDELTAIREVPDVVPPDAPVAGVIAPVFGRPSARQDEALPVPATGTDGPTKHDLYIIDLARRRAKESL